MLLQKNSIDSTIYNVKLCLNPSKCKTISIHKPKFFTSLSKYTLNNTELTSVEECKYLGPWLDTHLTFKTHVDETHAKLQDSLYRIYQLLKTNIKLYPNTIMQIYKTKSRPIVEYASLFHFHTDASNKP